MPAQNTPLSRRLSLWSLGYFSLTLFLSATLLFWVQPMVVKVMLPALGGAPAVWNSAMLFFQAALLLGYLYAHLTGLLSDLRAQVAAHAAVLAVAAALLPLTAEHLLPEGNIEHPALWVVGALALALGGIYAMIAPTAILLQRWFSHTRHAQAHDPYFLYAASNAGSMAGLIGYVAIVEPWIALPDQFTLWSKLVALLWCLIIGGGLFAWFIRGSRPAQATHQPREAITWAMKGRWLLWAFLPSSLLLGITQHITTDLAPVPLLWILPLAVYLVTFILAFANRQVVPFEKMVRVQCWVLPFLTFQFYPGVVVIPTDSLMIALNLLLFFASAFVCHRQLALHRPSLAHMSRYYLIIAFGGVLGGVFNVLVAPAIFSDYYEYPLALVIACALSPAPGQEPGIRRWDLLHALFVGTATGIAALILTPLLTRDALLVGIVVIVALFAVKYCLQFRERPLRVGLCSGAVMLALIIVSSTHRQELKVVRNYFGTLKVQHNPVRNLNTLMHGTTQHGMQSGEEKDALTPTLYYHPDGPLGQVFRHVRTHRSGRLDVGIAGLGTGAAACYGRKGDRFTFYEINPAVADIAADTRLFTYLSRCAPHTDVRIGDGRMLLAAAGESSFDLIVLDVFSSDAIPIHMLTREAFQLYMKKLKPGGFIAINISNRHLRLEKLMAALVQSEGWHGYVESDSDIPAAQKLYRLQSQWAVVAPKAAPLAGIAAQGEWKDLHDVPAATPWTDSYSALIGLLKVY